MVSKLPEPEIGDAFGALLRAEYEGELSHEIYEREDGTITRSAGPSAYFSPYEEWPAHERTAFDWVEGRVLDVGCGAGRHALELQERGHDVTGIDVSPGACAVAADRGVEDVRRVDVADVADELSGPYDTVLMLGTNFNLVGTIDRAPVILDGLAAVTAEGGKLIAESVDPSATAEHAERSPHDRHRERGRHPGEVTMRVRFGELSTPWFDVLQAAPSTMREIVTETPWTVTDVVADEGGAYVALLERC